MSSDREERSVVVALEGESAILLTQSGAFVEVPRRDLGVGDETRYVPPADGPRRDAPFWRPAVWRWGVAAACLAAMVVLVGGVIPTAYARTVAYVSVEVDPGFTLGLDAQGRVTLVEPEDADAKRLAPHLSLEGLPVATAVQDIVQAAVVERLVPRQSAALVVATYSAANGSIPSGLRKNIRDAVTAAHADLIRYTKKPVVQGVVVTADIVREARHKKLAVGQYVVWYELGKKGAHVSSRAIRKGVSEAIGANGGADLLQEVTDDITGSAPPGPVSPATQPSSGKQGGGINLGSGIQGLFSPEGPSTSKGEGEGENGRPSSHAVRSGSGGDAGPSGFARPKPGAEATPRGLSGHEGGGSGRDLKRGWPGGTGADRGKKEWTPGGSSPSGDGSNFSVPGCTFNTDSACTGDTNQGQSSGSDWTGGSSDN